jgi:DNA-binding CsgD family transcriptional regulator
LRRLFEDIGELALEPQSWPQVLDRICSAANAEGAMLVQGRSRTSGTPRTASMEEGVRFYFDHGWHERDLLARGIPMLLRGEKAYVTQDVVSPDEMQNEAFFHEVLYRHRQRWSAVVRVAAGSALWCVSLHRSTRQSAFEADDRPFLASLSDRLTETATLSAMVGQVALTSSLNALELVRRPAIAIDCFGNILDSNAAAEAMFDEELRVHMRRLVVNDAKAQSELTVLFARLRLSQELAGVAFDAIIVRKKNGLPTFIRPVPISGPARSPFLGACALLIFADCSRREPPNVALLARTFALSPSEARTAALLAKGLSIEESAQAAGLSRETIKSQLKTIFAKTGVRRQTSLIALLTSLPEL